MINDLLNDATFWVAISFTVFILLFLKYGRGTALASLDKKITEIKLELETAEKLRVDAQELLAEYQRKHKDAIEEANKIVGDATIHAAELHKKAEQDLAKTMDRRATQLDEKLARIEQNAAQEIQAYTAQIALNATRQLLNDKMDEKSDKKIIMETLKNIPETLN